MKASPSAAESGTSTVDHWFATRALGDGVTVIAPPGFVLEYEEVARRGHEKFTRFAERDAELFFTLDSNQHLRPVPDLTKWSIPAVAPTRSLADGELIDLGGRSLQVLHTPGHSPTARVFGTSRAVFCLRGDTVLSAA